MRAHFRMFPGGDHHHGNCPLDGGVVLLSPDGESGSADAVVYMRQLLYRRYYPARSTPFRDNRRLNISAFAKKAK